MTPRNILLIRFSALGDVALLLPVLSATKHANPDVSFTILTKKSFAPLFERMEGVCVKTLDAAGRHKGIFGLYRLFRSLKRETRYDQVIDLHQNLRTSFLKFFFRISGIPCHTIDKRRKERKRLTALKHKRLKPLPHVTELYAEAIRKAGLKTTDTRNFTVLPPMQALANQARTFLNTHFSDKKYIVGLAPFAHHPAKVWGLDKTEALAERLAQRGDTGIIIFGGKGTEEAFAESLQKKYPGRIISAIGQFSLNEEMELMRSADVMLTMDSANMHLANLTGTPTVSVWGATHPYAGFAPVDQARNIFVQISEDDLTCRPCSVFGNKPCFRGDHACMRDISVETVYETVEYFLSAKTKMDHKKV